MKIQILSSNIVNIEIQKTLTFSFKTRYQIHICNLIFWELSHMNQNGLRQCFTKASHVDELLKPVLKDLLYSEQEDVYREVLNFLENQGIEVR